MRPNYARIRPIHTDGATDMSHARPAGRRPGTRNPAGWHGPAATTMACRTYWTNVTQMPRVSRWGDAHKRARSSGWRQGTVISNPFRGYDDG